MKGSALSTVSGGHWGSCNASSMHKVGHTIPICCERIMEVKIINTSITSNSVCVKNDQDLLSTTFKYAILYY